MPGQAVQEEPEPAPTTVPQTDQTPMPETAPTTMPRLLRHRMWNVWRAF